MKKQEKLTKENFWNSMMEKYPYATANFCKWIDQYKEAVSWTKVFGEHVKFHDIPYAMQLGVWVQYALTIENIESYVEDVFTGYNWVDDLPKMIEDYLASEQDRYDSDSKIFVDRF